MRYLLLAILALSGCSSGGFGMVGSPAWFQTTTPEHRTEYFGKQCASYGFQPGTVAMASCIQSETQGARQLGAARAAAVISSAPKYQAPRRTTCGTVGGSVNCTTY